MSYGSFAYIYDKLMEDVPYDQWVAFVKAQMAHFPNAKTFLDVGCGTGELSIRLASEGFSVTGLDLSEDMLTVAKAKSEERQLNIPMFQQNMAEMEGLGSFDLVGIFCDSLNYLETEEQVQETFKRAYDLLVDGGLLLFDVHSIFKISQVFMNQTFGLNEDEISYIWHSYQGEHPNSIEHDLSFFVLREENGLYERYDELHFQRTFPISDYEKWLKEANFSIVNVTADFEAGAVQSHSERIFFVARK